MAITGGAILLPLDGLGAETGKFIIKSSRDSRLQPLDADGHQWGRLTGAATLPTLTSEGFGKRDISATGDVRLPRFTSVGYGGANGAPSLPAIRSTGAGTVNPVATGAITLPLLTATGEVTMGSTGTGALILPKFTSVGYGAGWGAATLPRLRTSAAGTSEIHGTAGAILPLLRTQGNVSVSVWPGYGAVILPMLQAGLSGRGTVLLPMLFSTSEPLLSVLSFEGWAINVRNKGVTRFTNFPFLDIVRVGTRTYGLRAEGIYLLGGDYDEVDPVVVPKPRVLWSFETGLTDAGKVGIKHVPYVYLDGIIDGAINITLLDDRNREFKYAYNTAARGAVHQPHRRKLGNGIRTRNVAFRIDTETGAYIELDAIEPEFTVTQRSI